MVKFVLKWNRRQIIKPKNMIISSDAVLDHNKGFIPSYYSEPPNIQKLLANQYMRQWFDEREAFEANYYYNPVKLEKKKFSPYRKEKPKGDPKKDSKKKTLPKKKTNFC